MFLQSGMGVAEIISQKPMSPKSMSQRTKDEGRRHIPPSSFVLGLTSASCLLRPASCLLLLRPEFHYGEFGAEERLGTTFGDGAFEVCQPCGVGVVRKMLQYAWALLCDLQHRLE